MSNTAQLATPLTETKSSFLHDHVTLVVRVIGWVVTVAVAFYSSWFARFSLNPDGLSYLDIAQNYLHHNFLAAINAYWSPLYSWLLAAGFAILRPSPYWELPVVQLVNFVIFLLTFVAFEFFWQSAEHRLRAEDTPDTIAMPRWAWMAIGYALFLWTITNATLVSEVTPDLLVAAIVYVLGALVLRMRNGDTRMVVFVSFGIVLALGYFSKTAMLVLAAPFLVTSFLTVKNHAKGFLYVATATLLLVVLSAPFIALISGEKGRLTIGESGRIGYAWVVNRAGPFLNWQGTDPEGDVGLHPTHKLLSTPIVYEFATPVPGTYPPHYDPSYWNEGMKPHFHLLPQIRTIFTSSYSIYTSIFAPQVGLVVAAFLALLLAGFVALKRLYSQWHLLIPAIAAFGLYALVTVEARYLAGFIVMFWAAILSAIRLPRQDWARRVFLGIAIAAIFSLTLSAVEKIAVRSYNRGPVYNGDWQIANGLHQLGIREGDRVMTVGSGYNAYWAHLGKMKIVAEIPNSELTNFWAGGQPTLSQVVAIADRLGAKAIVTADMPKSAPPGSWQEIASTGFYLYPVPQN